jgi:hypothetical protein
MEMHSHHQGGKSKPAGITPDIFAERCGADQRRHSRQLIFSAGLSALALIHLLTMPLHRILANLRHFS